MNQDNNQNEVNDKKQNEEVLNALGSDHTEEEQLVNDFAKERWGKSGFFAF